MGKYKRKPNKTVNKYDKFEKVEECFGDIIPNVWPDPNTDLIEKFVKSIRGKWKWHDSLPIPIEFKGRLIKTTYNWGIRCVYNESGDTCPVCIDKITDGYAFWMIFSNHSFNIHIQGRFVKGKIIGQCAYYPMKNMGESDEYLVNIGAKTDVCTSIVYCEEYQGSFTWTR